MLGKMKPKEFTSEELDAIRVESASQTTGTGGAPEKSADPENYPVFDIPVNMKKLIYVPKHTITGEDGTEELRMDKPLIHSVINGKKYQKIRCIHGLSEATGYSGYCPLCDGEDEPWDLANAQIREQCNLRGFTSEDKTNETVRSIKRDYYGLRVIKSAELMYTFPIVVIETDPSDIKKIVVDENKNPVHKTYWYTISKVAYEKKWLKTLEGMEDEPIHPGGHFFILNYTYDSKSGEYNKRDSARELQVVAKKIKNSEDLAKLYDKETEDWGVAKAISTIFDNMYYEEEDIEAETNKILASTREKLVLYKLCEKPPEAKESGFKLEPQIPAGSLPQGDEDDKDSLPMVGQTDEDNIPY